MRRAAFFVICISFAVAGHLQAQGIPQRVDKLEKQVKELQAALEKLTTKVQNSWVIETADFQVSNAPFTRDFQHDMAAAIMFFMSPPAKLVDNANQPLPRSSNAAITRGDAVIVTENTDGHLGGPGCTVTISMVGTRQLRFNTHGGACNDVPPVRVLAIIKQR